MRCTISHMPATVIAIPLLAMGLGVRAQEQVPGETYTADLIRPWTCDTYAERQARGWPPAGGEPFVVPLAEDPSPPGGEPVPQLVPAYPATPPSLGFNFAGAQEGDSSSSPPDTMGAVGPNYFMEVINGNVSIFQKSNGQRVSSESLGSFFQHSGWDTIDPVDPRVLFDQHSGRWIVVAIPKGGTDIGLAVSESDDPTGTFCKSSFIASAGLDAPTPPVYPFPDYPTLGVDANGIYIAAYMVGSGRTIWAIEKPPLLAVSPSSPSWGTVTAWRRRPGGSTHQPAHTYGMPGSEYIIGALGSSLNGLRIFRVDPPLSAPTMSTWTIPVEPWRDPPHLLPALDSAVGSGAESRLMMSVYRDGSLWTTHSIDVNGRAGIRWYQINPTYPLPPNQAVIQWGNVGHSSLHFYMPSLMVNRAGQVALAFSGSDASRYVGAYYTGRRAGDLSGAMAVPQLLKAGEGPYIGRWGDYSYTTLDPLDESTFWTIQEYAAPVGTYGWGWGTWIAALGPFAICNDNNGNSPLVCVDWDQPRPPFLGLDFSLGFGTSDPDVTFANGNDGWNVWSQVSRTDATPANLGHIGINPRSLEANFSVTIAHLASAGAANVASMALVEQGWTGQSKLFGSIAGSLGGDLVVQESGGQGGVAFFAIGGNVYGDITIPKAGAGMLEVTGTFDGNLCGENLSPTTPLPGNIHIATFGPNATICGAALTVIVWNADALSPDRTTRSLRFRVAAPATSPGSPGQSAIRVELVELGHPNPRNAVATTALPTQTVPQNFSTFDTSSNGVCSGATATPNYNGHPCNTSPDCVSGGGLTNGVCSSLVACTAANESVPPDVSGQGGCARWVGKPATFLEAQSVPGLGHYRAARLQCTPFYYDWVTETAGNVCAGPLGATNTGLPCATNSDCPSLPPPAAPATCVDKKITVVGAEILPSSTYSVRTYGSSCGGSDPALCSNLGTPVTMFTRRHGDVAEPLIPPDATGQPNGIDTAQIVQAFGKIGPLRKAGAKITPNLPEHNFDIGCDDIGRVVDAVKGFAYSIESGPCPCPSTVTCGTPCGCDAGPSCPTCGGGGNQCVKTCTGGGVNDGLPCRDNDPLHNHCPGGACGANAKCDAGADLNTPCSLDTQCASPGKCVGTAFCRDRCGRCTPSQGGSGGGGSQLVE